MKNKKEQKRPQMWDNEDLMTAHWVIKIQEKTRWSLR